MVTQVGELKNNTWSNKRSRRRALSLRASVYVISAGKVNSQQPAVKEIPGRCNCFRRSARKVFVIVYFVVIAGEMRFCHRKQSEVSTAMISILCEYLLLIIRCPHKRASRGNTAPQIHLRVIDNMNRKIDKQRGQWNCDKSNIREEIRKLFLGINWIHGDETDRELCWALLLCSAHKTSYDLDWPIGFCEEFLQGNSV